MRTATDRDTPTNTHADRWMDRQTNLSLVYSSKLSGMDENSSKLATSTTLTATSSHSSTTNLRNNVRMTLALSPWTQSLLLPFPFASHYSLLLTSILPSLPPSLPPLSPYLSRTRIQHVHISVLHQNCSGVLRNTNQKLISIHLSVRLSVCLSSPHLSLRVGINHFCPTLR